MDGFAVAVVVVAVFVVVVLLQIFGENIWGPGIAQWLESRNRDQKVAGLNPGRSEGVNFLLQVNFLSCPFHLRVTALAVKQTIPIIMPKVQVSGYS